MCLTSKLRGFLCYHLPLQVAISVVISQQQLASVNTHLASIHAMSGAQLQVSPGGGPGLFQLVVSGKKSQVETARSLLSSVIGGGQG